MEAIGFVFQQFNLIPTLTAAENVEAGLAVQRDLELTLILVTHEQWVAERADRVLRLDDGHLIADTPTDAARARAR